MFPYKKFYCPPPTSRDLFIKKINLIFKRRAFHKLCRYNDYQKDLFNFFTNAKGIFLSLIMHIFFTLGRFF